MDFRILGPLEVVDDDQPVGLGGPKQRAVLGLLLVSPGRVVSVDRLVDGLWAERPPPGARGTLHAYVSNLRRVLEPARSPRDPPRVLVTSGPGYVLQIDGDHVDASRFEIGAREGQRLLAARQPLAARRVLGDALALWRGPALGDFAFESFAQVAITRLEELRAVAVEDLIDAELELGEHAKAVAELEALVVEHPTRERLWSQLMVGLYRNGRQSEALGAFQRVRTLLGEELGLEPGPELRRIEHAILAHDQDLLGPHPPASDRIPGVVGESARALVGRADEVAVIERAVADAASGRGGAVLIAGEAGIGKTRLAQELATRARRRGVNVVWGRGYEGEGSPAFWPWIDVLRALISGADTDLVHRWATDLATLVPEVVEVVGDVTPPPLIDPVASRFRLCDALTRFLVGLAGQEPLLVVLDDMHWADPASLQLIGFLATYLPDARLVVAITYRDTDVGVALEQTLGQLMRQPNVRRMTLAGWSRAQVGEFLAAAGVDAGSELVAHLHARTDGNPFYISELVQLLRSEGDCSAVVEHVPAGVRDVVVRRVHQLPPDVRSLLEVAAVLGAEFSLDVLAAVERADPAEMLERLEPALTAGIVRQPEHGPDYRFSHTLVRDALYDHVGPGRRVRLHRRAGEVLEGLRTMVDDGRVGQLAYHYDRAGVAANAARWLFESARRARRSYLNEEAAERFDRARAWLERVPSEEATADDGHPLVVDLHEELGDTLRALARHVDARSSYRMALEGAGATWWRRRARIERKIGITLGSEGRFLAALEAYAGAERLLEHDPVRDDDWWAEWLDSGIEEMWIHYQAGDWKEMESVARRLQPAAEDHGRVTQKVGLARTLGAIALRRDRYVVGDEVLAHSRAAVSAADLSGDDVLRGSAWFSLGFALLWHGDSQGAETALRLALELSRRTGDVSTETACHTYLSVGARLRGDVALVAERGTLAQARAISTGAPGYVAAARANLAWVALRQGARGQAERMAREALEGWQGCDVSHAFHWLGTWPLLQLAVDRGDAGEARALATRLLGAEQQRPPLELEARLTEAAAEGASDDVVLGAVHRALPVAQERGYI